MLFAWKVLLSQLLDASLIDHEGTFKRCMEHFNLRIKLGASCYLKSLYIYLNQQSTVIGVLAEVATIIVKSDRIAF